MAKRQKYPHLLGSQWTARQATLGWRHFRVINRKSQGSYVFAELVAACAPEVRLWINARVLFDREIWLPGWHSREQLGLTEPMETAETRA